jgi:hypothetical protein
VNDFGPKILKYRYGKKVRILGQKRNLSKLRRLPPWYLAAAAAAAADWSQRHLEQWLERAEGLPVP